MKNIAFLALVIGSSACGNITGKFSADASSDSGSTDGGTDASITQMVNVVTQTHVTGGGAVGAVANNIQIIALRPNGTMSDNKMTDATGVASVEIYPGGSVTAIYPHVAAVDNGADLVTFVGVKGGDNLTFGARNQPAVTPTTIGTITFTWPTYANATYYYVDTPCGEVYASAPTLSTTVTVTSNCNASPFQVEFFVYTSTTGTYPAYSSNQITTVAASQTLQNFGWEDVTEETLTLSATGLPAEVTSVSANVTASTSFDYTFFGGNLANANSPPTGNAFAATLHPFEAGSRLYAELDLARTGGFREVTVLDGLQTFAQQWTVANPPLTPWMTDFVVPTGMGQALWFMDKLETSAPYNGTVLTMEWQHLNTTTTNYDNYNWNVILPPDATTLTLPVLPGAAAAFTPGPNDSVYGNATLLTIPSVTGYDGLRAVAEKDLISPTDAVISGDVPRVIYSEY